MTTLQTPEQGGDESLTEAVARRLRGQLAEQMISKKQFSELTGWNRMLVYRRLRGEIPLNTAEFELIERTTGISPEFLLTGKPSNGPFRGTHSSVDVCGDLANAA